LNFTKFSPPLSLPPARGSSSPSTAPTSTFERIAAKLLGDPGFTDETSPLYDPIQEPSHTSPEVADLDFFVGEEKNLTDEQQILQNLRVMYK